jgi:flagellar protein FlaG
MQSVQVNSSAQPSVAAAPARSPAGADAPRATTSPAAQVVRSAASATPSANFAANPAAPNFNPSDMVKRIEQVVDQMREMAKQNNRDLAFDIDQLANRFVIRVTNPTSGELVRQIPTEDILRIAHRIDSMKGVIFEDLF